MILRGFVEGESDRRVIERLLRLLVPDAEDVIVTAFNGRARLIRDLGQRLAGLRHECSNGMRAVVVLDRDTDDCGELLERVRQIAQRAGYRVWPANGDGCELIVRIAIEEMEAWFLGDPVAVHAAYPGVPATFGQRRGLREPDEVRGPAEALARLLGQNPAAFRKLAAADAITPHLEIGRNSSPSFEKFCHGVQRLAGQGRAAANDPPTQRQSALPPATEGPR